MNHGNESFHLHYQIVALMSDCELTGQPCLRYNQHHKQSLAALGYMKNIDHLDLHSQKMSPLYIQKINVPLGNPFGPLNDQMVVPLQNIGDLNIQKMAVHIGNQNNAVLPQTDNLQVIAPNNYELLLGPVQR